jgi:hypothetical protein
MWDHAEQQAKTALARGAPDDAISILETPSSSSSPSQPICAASSRHYTMVEGLADALGLSHSAVGMRDLRYRADTPGFSDGEHSIVTINVPSAPASTSSAVDINGDKSSMCHPTAPSLRWVPVTGSPPSPHTPRLRFPPLAALLGLLHSSPAPAPALRLLLLLLAQTASQRALQGPAHWVLVDSLAMAAALMLAVAAGMLGVATARIRGGSEVEAAVAAAMGADEGTAAAVCPVHVPEHEQLPQPQSHSQPLPPPSQPPGEGPATATKPCVCALGMGALPSDPLELLRLSARWRRSAVAVLSAAHALGRVSADEDKTRLLAEAVLGQGKVLQATYRIIEMM